MIRYKTVFLDIDNTLYDYSSAHKAAFYMVLHYLKQECSLDSEIAQEYYSKARNQIHQELFNVASMHNRLLYFQRMFELLNANPFPHAFALYNLYWDTFIDNIQLDTGVVELLEKLGPDRLCFLTDMTADIQHKKISKLNLSSYVKCMVTSEEAGVEKPSEKIFNLALLKMNAIPSSSCMIGDSYNKDIIGAIALGIRCYWINRTNEMKPQNELVHEIQSFNELLRILE